jgi:hypothetical protein
MTGSENEWLWARSRWVPFLWLSFAMAQIKVDGEEAIYPFFRIALFLALPFALLHLFAVTTRAKFSLSQWLGLGVVSYLMLYPYVTLLLWGSDDLERDIKDGLYTLAVYAVLFFFVRRCFLDSDGKLNVDAIGRFWVAFAVLHSAIALVLWMGVSIHPSAGLEFRQMGWLDGRLHGLLGTPTHLAPLVAIACIYLLIQRPTITNTLALAGLLVVLVMTGSRGALLGFVGAAALFVLSRVHSRRFQIKGVFRAIGVVCITVGLAALFPEQVKEVLSVALRSDPADWEKSRPVIWAARLYEFSQSDVMTQLFGSGHRSLGGSFNINLDNLLYYGLIYTIIFNLVYFALLFRFFTTTVRSGRSRDAFFLMVGVFCYLFAQGINYMLHAFVHIFQFCMVLLLVAYFGRDASPARVALRAGPGQVLARPGRVG